MSVINKNKCQGITKKGNQCARRATMGNYCLTHKDKPVSISNAEKQRIYREKKKRDMGVQAYNNLRNEKDRKRYVQVTEPTEDIKNKNIQIDMKKPEKKPEKKKQDIKLTHTKSIQALKDQYFEFENREDVNPKGIKIQSLNKRFNNISNIYKKIYENSWTGDIEWINDDARSIIDNIIKFDISRLTKRDYVFSLISMIRYIPTYKKAIEYYRRVAKAMEKVIHRDTIPNISSDTDLQNILPYPILRKLKMPFASHPEDSIMMLLAIYYPRRLKSITQIKFKTMDDYDGNYILYDDGVITKMVISNHKTQNIHGIYDSSKSHTIVDGKQGFKIKSDNTIRVISPYIIKYINANNIQNGDYLFKSHNETNTLSNKFYKHFGRRISSRLIRKAHSTWVDNNRNWTNGKKQEYAIADGHDLNTMVKIYVMKNIDEYTPIDSKYLR